jgi:hypothetical protein
VSQGRLFERAEMAVSVRVFVRGKLEGFAIRQAARAQRRQRRAALRASAADSPAVEPQACFAFGAELESLLEKARTPLN